MATEVFLQLPFFFYGIPATILNHKSFRIPGLICKTCLFVLILYNIQLRTLDISIIDATHVLTTLIPVIGSVLLNTTLPTPNRLTLLSIYASWSIIPWLMLWRYSIGYSEENSIKSAPATHASATTAAITKSKKKV